MTALESWSINQSWSGESGFFVLSMVALLLSNSDLDSWVFSLYDALKSDPVLYTSWSANVLIVARKMLYFET